MNNTNNTTNTYAAGTWVRSHTFSDGGELLKLSISVDKFTEFLKEHKKADGYVNLTIQKKKVPDDKSSHTVKLDTWVPKTQAGQVAATTTVKTSLAKTKNPEPQVEIESDDVAF